jgi:hypothetical protein
MFLNKVKCTFFQNQITYFMKLHPFRTIYAVAALSFLSLTFVACDKDVMDGNNGDPVYTTSGDASGSQQNPPVTTSATATLFGEFNARTNNWEYRINFTGLSSAASAVNIHGPASIGATGDFQFALAISTPGTTGKAEGNVQLSEQMETYLLANQLYYTIVNTTYLGGEIRGQITAVRTH